MSVVGQWNVTIKTPFGEQAVTLEFGDESSGVVSRGSESIDLRDVSTSGDDTTFTVTLTQPVSVTANCAVTVDGDAMSGTASAGFFGKFPLTGERIAA